ncbi:MAG TPA: tetratricopeptide repeat protein [Ignavibacteriales bacterium]|nr:tetratricopeptide repeat protein [Ignavibacteriales bacterium]
MLHLEYKLKKASDYEAQGKYLHAIQIYTEIIAESPEHTLSYIKLASLYDKMRNFNASVKLLKHYIANVSDDSEIRLYLGQMLIKYSLWDEAIEALSIFNPEEHPIHFFFLGYSYFMLKEFEIARINFQNYLEKSTSTEFHFEAYIYQAKIEIELQNFDEALKAVKQAEELFSNSWEVHLLYGIIFYSKGMHFHAATSIEKALKLNNKEVSLHEWAGKAYLQLGDYQSAEKHLSEYVSNADASSEAYTCLALACMNTQRLKDAGSYFELALNLDPNNQVALEGKKKCKP